MRLKKIVIHQLRSYLTAIVLLMFLQPLHAHDERDVANASDRSLPELMELQLTPEEQAWLADHPVIEFGGSVDLSPFNFMTLNGQLQGYNVDLTKIINEAISSEIKIVAGEWIELQGKVRQREIDGLMGPSYTAERSQYMVFTESYISVPYAIFTREDHPQVNGIGDFEGQTIAIHEGSSSIEFFEKSFPGVRLNKSRNHLEALLSVSTGQSAAAYMVLPAGLFEINNNLITDLRVAAVIHGEDVDIRLGIRSDWPQLASIFQKVIDSITDEQWQRLTRKWIITPEKSAPERMSLTDKEQFWLQNHPVIRVLISDYSAPVEFRDENGQYQGISVEYLNHLEELLGIHFELAEGVSWAEGLEQVSNKQLDMISSIAITEQRKQSLLFTKTFNLMPVKIFARNDISYIGSLDNLAGHKVAINHDTPLINWLTRDYPDLKLVPVKPPTEGLTMLADGKVDAFVDNMVTTSYYIGKLHLNNVRIAGETPYSNDQAMAVRKDWPVFAVILQKALDSIDEQQRQAFYNRWMSIRYEVETDYTIIWQVLFVAAIVIGLFIYWNRRLAREIVARKQTETSLKLMQAELNKKERLSILGQLTATVSHELRNPLGTIKTSLELVKIKFEELGVSTLPVLDRLNRSVDRCNGIINELLDYTRIRPENFEELALDECLAEILAELTIPEDIEIQQKLDSQAMVLIDRGLLQRAVINVVENACQAMEDSEGVKRLTIVSELEEDRCLLLIKDTGSGIKPDSLEQVFEPMYSTKTYGVGLGMTIVLQIMKQLNGGVEIKSEEGQGTELCLWLPLLTEMPQTQLNA